MARHCSVLASVGASTASRPRVLAGIERIGEIKIDAQHLATLGLVPQTIATADLGTWRHALRVVF